MSLSHSVAEATPRAALEPFRTRRTFAIISHPDAGKTTLTERLLAAAGAIQLAGAVRGKAGQRSTRSDWMEMEQQRGISITSSVMTFDYDGLTLNLLDTPGHSDFSEDTYRTLTAVDAAIMVIDAAKGIEAQTQKLFEVCRLRDIPIITFINKVDREGIAPLDLIDEIQGKLALDLTPVLWPIGMGVDFFGYIDLLEKRVVNPQGKPIAEFEQLEDLLDVPALADNAVFMTALETLEMAQAMLPSFDLETFHAGHLSPVLFGSALRGISVAELLRTLGEWGPEPRPQPAIPAPIDPSDKKVTGFVFKVQANMDANHRDRIAFVRLCSGTFERGMRLKNVRSGKDMAVSNPMFFFGNNRELAEEAVAGDIVGIPNHGTLSVGDTLTEGPIINVTGIPNFAPEIIRRVRLTDHMKTKQMSKALTDLSEEGVTQVFRRMVGADWIVGVVGQLQLEVLASRVGKEYGVPITFEPLGFEVARWVESDDDAELNRFIAAQKVNMAEDRSGAPVFLAQNAWWADRAKQDWPKIRFLTTKERH
ncbi:peptide chain release factor 3 [Devosia sp. SD17-2]|jgi:peptide chain release factor 3|uniref:peptide chain release factor 3 n=1 Tax=Devosia sp. SD17-2 TaxID=2976459 RepID=UPI0023D7ECC4|nr:peptide chain release factor 3 [Devosia sp. SD17-2]WEJ34803.1 peptide chain release factor 3 [Devosia sp. SD17-2]